MTLKPFQAILGPKGLPLIGNLYEYTLTKKYDFKKLYQNGLQKYLQYGPVVKEEIIAGLPIIWIYDPVDVEALKKAEGKFPSRRSHLALEHYRKTHRIMILNYNTISSWLVSSLTVKFLSFFRNSLFFKIIQR